MILKDFERCPKGFDWKYDCYGLQSGYRANKLHICKLMFYFLFSYNPKVNVMFVLLLVVVSATDRIDSKLVKSYLNQVDIKFIHTISSYGNFGFFQY